MKRSHAFVFALVIGVTVVLALGTGSFSAADTTRDMTLETSDDAYLGVDTASPTSDPGTESTVDLLTLTNGFETEFETVSVATDHDNVSTVEHADSLAIDEETTVQADVTCGSESFTVDFDVAVEGEGVSVETTEAVTVCDTA